MKTRDIEFRANGIAAVLQSPHLAKSLVRATNIGTLVEQESGTQAWFHIPIPSHAQIATCVNNNCFVSQTQVESLYLDAKVNENARIDRIHLRDGVTLFADKDVSYIDRDLHENLSLSASERNHFLSGGVAMSIHVVFLSGTPRGRVEIRSAGVRVKFKLSN